MSIQHTTRERSIELQGEIKRAQDVVVECSLAVGDKQKTLEGAEEDLRAANVRLAGLIEERRVLAQQAHDEVMGCEAQPGDSDEDMVNRRANAATGSWLQDYGPKVANSELPEF